MLSDFLQKRNYIAIENIAFFIHTGIELLLKLKHQKYQALASCSIKDKMCLALIINYIK